MSDLEKILQLVQKNDGYITTKEVVDNGLNKMALKRLCDGGILERVSTGYYSLPNMINDDYYKIISKSKNAILHLYFYMNYQIEHHYILILLYLVVMVDHYKILMLYHFTM